MKLVKDKCLQAHIHVQRSSIGRLIGKKYPPRVIIDYFQISILTHKSKATLASFIVSTAVNLVLLFRILYNFAVCCNSQLQDSHVVLKALP